jgi:Flp pilus assembly protein TadG
MKRLKSGPADFARAAKHFAGRREGGTAVFFAVGAVPLMLAVGGAVDYGRAITARAELSAAADAAALAAAQTAAKAYSESKGNWSNEGTIAGRRSFTARSGSIAGVTVHRLSTQPAMSGTTISAEVTYSATVTTNFLRVLGLRGFSADGTAVSSIKAPVFTDIHLVIDNSESMGIGATANDIQININTIGCSVACHFGNTDASGKGMPERARAAGSTLRIDVVKQATLSALNRVQGLMAQGRVRVAVYTLSSGLTPVFPLSSNIAGAIAAIQKIDLTSTPGQGGSNMTYSLQQLATSLPQAGNGLNKNQPQGFVMLMTDGVQDAATESLADGSTPVPDPKYVLFPPIGPEWSIQAFDPSACAPIKNRNYTMVTLEAKYVIPSFAESDVRYSFIRDVLAGSIAQNMAACASSANNAYVADAPADFQQAIYNMFASALSSNLALKK